MPDVFLLDTILLDSLALNLQSILQKHDWNLKIKVEEVKVQSGQCSGIYNLVAKRKKKQYMSFCFSKNNNLSTQFKVHIVNYFLLNFYLVRQTFLTLFVKVLVFCYQNCSDLL